MLRDFVGWSSTHASSAADYVTAASVIKLAALLAVLAGLLLGCRGARRLRARPRPPRRRPRCWPRRPPSPRCSAAILAPIAYAIRLPHSPLNTSAVGRAASTLAVTQSRAGGGSPWLSLDDALASLRRLTHTAPFDPSHPLVGAEAGSDLLIFMMETGPAQAFERGAGAIGRARPAPSRMPSSRRATTPRTPTAATPLFAVLSGTYPHGRRLLLQDLGSRRSTASSPGCRPTSAGAGSTCRASTRSSWTTGCTARSARGRSTSPTGIPTIRCGPAAVARAEAMLRDLGGDRLDAGGPRPPARLLISDLQALERLKADIARDHRRRRPLRGDVLPGNRPRSVAALRRRRRRAGSRPGPDGSAGRVARRVARRVAAGRRLDRTVVALTADHGLRTRADTRRCGSAS